MWAVQAHEQRRHEHGVGEPPGSPSPLHRSARFARERSLRDGPRRTRTCNLGIKSRPPRSHAISRVCEILAKRQFSRNRHESHLTSSQEAMWPQRGPRTRVTMPVRRGGGRKAASTFDGLARPGQASPQGTRPSGSMALLELLARPALTGVVAAELRIGLQ